MKKTLIYLIFNVIIFIILRYFNILLGFLAGFGSAPYYQKWYVNLIHLPSLFVHITILLIIFLKKDNKVYLFISLILLVLFLFSHFKWIDNHWFLPR